MKRGLMIHVVSSCGNKCYKMGPKQGTLDSHQSFNDDLYGHKMTHDIWGYVLCRREIFFYINSLEVNVCGNGIYYQQQKVNVNVASSEE
jgi:hypothetical protein